MMPKLPMTLVERAEKVFSVLWKTAAHIHVPVRPDNGVWYFTISEHAGGLAVGFWVFSLSRHLKRRRRGKGIPRKYRRSFEDILSGGSPVAEMGRAMLCHYIQFFYAIDETWTQDHLLPLLNWESDEESAERAWHCYLQNPRVNPNAFETCLQPYYKQTFSRLDRLGILRESFVGHIALFAVEGSVDPLLDNWLDKYVSHAHTADREKWAWTVGHHLESLTPEAVKEVWQRWLDNYWRRRNSGIPVPLEPGEAHNMLHWLPHLRPVFPDAVERIRHGTPPDEIPYYELARIEWLVDYPEPLADLLYFLLRHTSRQGFYGHRDAIKLLRIISEAGVELSKRKEICDKLLELGCTADELEEFLR